MAEPIIWSDKELKPEDIFLYCKNRNRYCDVDNGYASANHCPNCPNFKEKE